MILRNFNQKMAKIMEDGVICFLYEVTLRRKLSKSPYKCLLLLGSFIMKLIFYSLSHQDAHKRQNKHLNIFKLGISQYGIHLPTHSVTFSHRVNILIEITLTRCEPSQRFSSNFVYR